MNLNDLTVGQARELASMFGGGNTAPQHPYVGKYVIARCYSAGVHAGTVESVNGETAILKDSRRLWSWTAVDGVALSGVAQTGVKSGCKIDLTNPSIYLTGVCELIPCSVIARESIDAHK